MCLGRETFTSFIISSFQGHLLCKHPWTNGPKSIGNPMKNCLPKQIGLGTESECCLQKAIYPSKAHESWASLPDQPRPACSGLQAAGSHPNPKSGRSWIPKPSGLSAENQKRPGREGGKNPLDRNQNNQIIGGTWERMVFREFSKLIWMPHCFLIWYA